MATVDPGSLRRMLRDILWLSSSELRLALRPNLGLRLRCVVRPDKAQALLLDRLGLRLPERLRQAPLVAQV